MVCPLYLWGIKQHLQRCIPFSSHTLTHFSPHACTPPTMKIPKPHRAISLLAVTLLCCAFLLTTRYATAFAPGSLSSLQRSLPTKVTSALQVAPPPRTTANGDDDSTVSMELSSSFNNNKRLLKDCVCLVTGASRGIGKGIALELAAQGATVYITGTSTTTTAKTDTQSDPGTIQETAEQINQLGGKGIAVCCDHSQDDQVQALMDQIAREQPTGLDILVNNAFRLPAGGVERLYGKFWEQGPEVWDTLHTVGLRSHFVASCFAMPLMLQAKQHPKQHLPRPLIGMISSFGGLTYTFNVPYGVGKAGVDRLAKDMAKELRPEDISVISYWPGLVDTERTQVAVANGEWDKYVKLPLDNAETPRFTGRAIVATALDPDNLKTKSGTYQVVAELAQEYGFTDVNGNVPPSIRSLQFLIPSYASDQFPAAWMDKIPDWKLPFWVMAQGQPPSD